MKLCYGIPIVVLLAAAVVIVQPPIAKALEAEEVNAIAKQITVRIDEANTGSGVIINHQGNTYTVLTDWHVLQNNGNYTIQTFDGRRYTIKRSSVKRLPKVDLAELQFTSTENYRKAELSSAVQLSEAVTVYAAGWISPDTFSTERDYEFSPGSITRIVRQPKNGYALIYTNKIKPGMSGGPLLDEQGRVVGINGIASTDIRTGVTDFAGIPISTYVKLASVAESFQPKASITLREIANIAKQVTVLIQSQKPRYGSGVIIKRVGNTYTILTTAHVIDVPDKYEIVTADNQHYQLNYSSIKRLPGVDLAVAEFTSKRTYKVAKIGNSDTAEVGTYILVSGYSEPSYAINQSIYTFRTGIITASASKPLRDGYALVYSNDTEPGMSGGPVLNNNGELVGIHGRGDVDTKETRTGLNLGIPINTYVRIR